MSTTENNQLSLVNLNDLPNLHEAEASPRELSSEYWTPENENDYKVGVIIEVKEETYVNEESGEAIILPCVIMLAQNTDKTFSTIRNGSKRLVATVQSALENKDVIAGQTPVKITYVGNQKNKTNGFKSDRWSVKPLILN